MGACTVFQKVSALFQVPDNTAVDFDCISCMVHPSASTGYHIKLVLLFKQTNKKNRNKPINYHCFHKKDHLEMMNA